jgi:AcrR family transcriptional regulator
MNAYRVSFSDGTILNMASQTRDRQANGGLVGYGEGGGAAARLPAPPTQARGAEKRDRIYQAAISLYGAGGLAATRVEDVIAEAEVSWATFFRYFPRKEDVLIEMAARHFRAHVRGAAEAGLSDRRLSVRTVTERTFAALLQAVEVSDPLHSAALLEVFASPARFAALVDEEHPQPMVGLVAELLGEAQRRGELRAEIDPGAAALTVVAGALLPGAQAAAAGLDPTAPVSSALDLLWEGLAKGRSKSR